MGQETKSSAPVTPRTSARSNGYNLRMAQKSERCSDCGKLVRPDEMERHMRYHGGDKPLRCPKCPKTFAEKNSLQKHILTHSDVDKDKEKSKPIKAATPPAKKIIAKAKVAVETTKPKRVTPLPLQPKAQETVEKKEAVLVSPPSEKNESKNPPAVNNGSVSPSSDSSVKANNVNPEKTPERLEPKEELSSDSTDLQTQNQKDQSSLARTKNQNVINSIRKKYNLPAAKVSGATTSNSFPCHCCDMVFSTLRLRTRHVLLNHKQHPYQCQLCPKSFLRSSSLTQHSTFHSEQRPFKCQMCPATFRYHSNLYSHRFTHKEYGSLECNLCGKKFRHSTTLWSHVQKHREQYGGKSKTFSSVMKYDADTNGSDEFEGEPEENDADLPIAMLAEKWAKQEPKLEEPDLDDPPNLDPEEYHTPTFMTGADFDRITMAAAAQQVKSEVKKEQKFLREPPPLIPSPKISHELRIRKTSPESRSADTQLTMCPICYKSFPLEYLQTHLQIHAEPDKPYQCQYCEKSYSKRFEVIQHEYSHTGERPYVCEHCGNSFRYKSNYCRHKRTRAVRGTCEGKVRGNSYFGNEFENLLQPEVSISNPHTQANNTDNEEAYDEDLNGDENLEDFIEEDNDPAPWELFKFAAEYGDEGQAHDEDEEGRMTSSETDPLSDDGVANGSPEILARLNISLPDLIIDEVVMMDGEEDMEDQEGQIQNHGQRQSLGLPQRGSHAQVQHIQNRNNSQMHFSAPTFSLSNHTNDGPPVTCTICNKQFQSQRHLTLHKRQHVKDRRVTCKLCNKTFAHRFSLTQHALVHTGEMPFSCDLCNKQFRFKSNYTKHNKQHHPELVAQNLNLPPQRYRKIPVEEIQYADEPQEGQEQGEVGNNSIKNPVIIQHLQRQQQQQPARRLSQPQMLPMKQPQLHGFARLLPKLVPATPPSTTQSQSQSQNQFPCNYCEEAFDDASELRLHTLSHKLGLSYSRTKSIDVE